MPIDTNLLDRLRSRGEEVFTQLSAELMSNPRFMRAMEGALRGKEKVEDAAGEAIKTMSIPTRSEFKKALRRIDTLEREVAALEGRVKAQDVAKKKARAKARPKTGGSPAKRARETAKKAKKAF